MTGSLLSRRGATGPRPIAIAVLALFTVATALAAAPAPAPAQAPAEPAFSMEVIRTDGVEGTYVSQANPKVAAQVWDIEFIGDTAYVAGQFLQVVLSTSDWSRVDQPFLAAFDASNGKWDPSFRPVLDGPVWALDQLDGTLVAGGEFTAVNGLARGGIVALDPATGATAPGFGAEVDRPFSDLNAVVRDIHTHGDDVYAVGNFSRASGAGVTMEASKAVRFSASTGEPDTAWTPVLAGRSGWAIDTNGNGSRVFLGGEFTYVNGVEGTELFAAVDGTTGALLQGYDHGFNAPRRSQWPLGGIVYDVAVAEGKVFLAGAEHFWETRAVSDGASVNLVLEYQGNWFNDTQVVELEDGTVYIGCHCLRHRGYANHDIDPATDTITGTLTAGMAGGDGVWAVATAPDGCIWMGGDLRGTPDLYGAPDDGRLRWVGRFARFCQPGGPPPPAVTEQVLLPAGSDWSVLAEADWPQDWTEPNFNDGAWTAAQAQFGYGDDGEVTLVDDSARPAAVLGRTSFTVADPGAFEHVELDLLVDDGATVWLNGDLVAAHNMAAGTLEPTTLASAGVWGQAERERHTYRIDPANLVAGENVIAVSVHQAFTGSVDLGFDLEVSGSTIEVDAFDTPPSISIAGPAPVIVELRALEDANRYLVGTSAPPAAWTQPGFDDGDWEAGAGVIGFNESTGIDTDITPGAITYYLRATFDVAADQASLPATASVLRDDGVVLYINGTEVGRDTMADGLVTVDTLASSFLWGRAELAPAEFIIPASLLQPGRNVVAAEVHQAHPDSADLRLGVEIRSNP